jgi:5-methylcytosine-specific restriction endonuclease McrA
VTKRFTLSEKAYAKLRTEVYQRDQFRCRVTRCSATNVSAHHIRFRSEGGPDTSGNLVCLCSLHHSMAHGLVKGKYLVISAPGDPSGIPNADIGLKFTIYNKPQRRNKWNM